MTKNKFSFLCLAAWSLCAGASMKPAPSPLGFDAYVEAVEKHSLALASQRQSIVAADAGVSVAGVRPDPELSFGIGPREYSRAVDPKPPVETSIGLSWVLETGGKRGKRIHAAESEVRLAQATFEGFRDQLYAESATAFAEACRTRDALVRQESSLAALSEVVRANEVRRRAGDAGGLELRQSRVERDQFQAEVVKARATARAAMVQLSVPLGQRLADTFGEVELACDFAPVAIGEDVDALVRRATDARRDVQIARASLAAARANAELAQADRLVDPTLSLGYGRTPVGRGGFDDEGRQLADSPRSRALTLGVSIPIPFSRMQRGERVRAEAAVTQAMLDLRAAELKADADVRSTFLQYQAADDNLRRYRESVLEDADKVLSGFRLSYRHGEASLLELLAAQRSADDTWSAYLQAKADLASAAVELQLSVGLRPSL